MLLSSIPLTDTINYVASQTQSIKIPRNRFIREIQCKLEVNTTNGATGPTLSDNGILDLVKRLRLRANGKDIKFECPMAWRYYEQQYIQGTAPQLIQPSTTANATSTGYAEASMHFAQDENNENDIIALLPAAAFTDLQLEADWGANTDIATANPPTINAASTLIRVTLVEAVLTDEDIAVLKSLFNGEAKLLNKIVRYLQITTDNSYSNFGFSKNILTGSLVERHTIFVVDNSIRSDAEYTQFRFFQYSPVKTELENRRWAESQYRNKRTFHIESIVRGMTMVDWKSKGYLNLTKMKDGDIKFEANTNSPTATSYIGIVQTEYN